MSLRNTPLLAVHKSLGAKMVDFGGWNMPVQYRSIIEEHKAVREKVGLFDVCHMGEIEVKGEGALSFLQSLTPNDVSSLTEGDVQYSALLNEEGGIIDDLLIYAISETRFFLCVNAANTDTDLTWLDEQATGFPDVTVTDQSHEYGMLALQGPNAEPLLKSLLPTADLKRIGYYQFVMMAIEESNIIVSRTGYTGEDGFEIFCHWRQTAELWKMIVGKGKPFGLQPVGLGARDTLRLEMRYPLHGSDIDETTTPLEAGLGWIVKLEKAEDFIGREKLERQKENGLERKLVAIKMTGRGIPRHGYAVHHDGIRVGEITSGAMSPTIGVGVGMAYLPQNLAESGTELAVEIRGKEVAVRVHKGPFVPSHTKKNVSPPQMTPVEEEAETKKEKETAQPEEQHETI